MHTSLCTEGGHSRAPWVLMDLIWKNGAHVPPGFFPMAKPSEDGWENM